MRPALLFTLLLLTPIASATHAADPLEGHTDLHVDDPRERAPTQLADGAFELLGEIIKSAITTAGEVLSESPRIVRAPGEAVIGMFCEPETFYERPQACIALPDVMKTLCVTFEKVGDPVAGVQPRKPVLDTSRPCEDGFVEMPED